MEGSVEQLLAEAQHLVAQARAHERQLWSLVTSLEADGAPARSADLLTLIRELCVSAREQRQRIESLVTGMLGDSAVRDAHHARVLIVDDSEDFRELAAAVLEAAGFHVIIARDGLEAVVAAHCEHPAVVVMDVTMPVLDGIEAARLIKASEGTRHINFLAHTATPVVFPGSLPLLFVGVLRKPTTPEALVGAVRRLVEPASAED